MSRKRVAALAKRAHKEFPNQILGILEIDGEIEVSPVGNEVIFCFSDYQEDGHSLKILGLVRKNGSLEMFT